MTGRDMRHFMPHHEGQFSLVVHQRQQLPGDVDIAAGYGEGVVHIGIQQGDGVVRRPRAATRLHGNLLANAPHIIRHRPAHGATELLQDLRMGLRAGSALAFGQAGGCLRQRRDGQQG